MTVPGWIDRAACRGMPTAVFFPEGRGASDAEALAVCQGCPVREACADYAVTQGLTVGIWGGMTAEDRAAVRRAA